MAYFKKAKRGLPEDTFRSHLCTLVQHKRNFAAVEFHQQ
eukprot:12754.XXX_538207_538323_1 [CDS] Oithona nana genome sequencing.